MLTRIIKVIFTILIIVFVPYFIGEVLDLDTIVIGEHSNTIVNWSLGGIALIVSAILAVIIVFIIISICAEIYYYVVNGK